MPFEAVSLSQSHKNFPQQSREAVIVDSRLKMAFLTGELIINAVIGRVILVLMTRIRRQLTDCFVYRNHVL